MDSNQQKRVIFEISEKSLKTTSKGECDRFVFTRYFKPLLLDPPKNIDPDDLEHSQQLLRSPFGYLFLDRTRIKPAGFDVGEFLDLLPLAANEEVIVEQRAFSKREKTFEELSESEQQFDLELSSILSTDLTEGLDRTQNHSVETTSKTAASTGGNVKVPVPETPLEVGGDVKADASFSKSINDASEQAARRSVKDTTTSSSRVASKYRAAHKTTFRVVTEDRFESTSKRVIKNPNQYTPIGLIYFKVMQCLDLTQERYGARLCWKLAVANPASEVVTRIQVGREKIIERHLSTVEKPARPLLHASPEHQSKTVASAQIEADKWGLTGDMRAEYEVPIDIPAGYVWDGDTDVIARMSSSWGRPANSMSWNITGSPWIKDDKLWVRVHVGASSWVNGPKIFIQTKAAFIPKGSDNDLAYKEELRKWRLEVSAWEALVAEKMALPRMQAMAAADDWEASVLANINPISEAIDRIIKAEFGGSISDEAWEVEFWTQIFDWEGAALSLQPSYWSTSRSNDPSYSPNHFLNASWAQLYLPVRPGRERVAMRWIASHLHLDTAPQTIKRPGGGALPGIWRLPEKKVSDIERHIDRVVDELNRFRQESFGDATETSVSAGVHSEKFIKLATWSETLPTDGTHLEVVQGTTTALDAITGAQIQNERMLEEALTADRAQNVELKKRAVAQLQQSAKDKLLRYVVSVATEDKQQLDGSAGS